MNPLIGITTGTRIDPETGNQYNAAYVPIIQAVERAGGLPVLIPSHVSNETLNTLYVAVDGLLLPGGGDIHASHYHEALHPKSNFLDAERDRAELLLARRAVADDLPVFGICRGHQLLNVAMGGSLFQDIPSQMQDHLIHEQYPALARNQTSHAVMIDASSRLAQIVGTTRLEVNSLHHQAVRDPAPHFNVVAVAPDEVVEAIELPTKRFVLSVQWHPEDLALNNPHMHNLFAAFVRAAAERHG